MRENEGNALIGMVNAFIIVIFFCLIIGIAVSVR